MVLRCEIHGSIQGCTWNKNRFSDTIRQQQRILLCNILFRFGSTISVSLFLQLDSLSSQVRTGLKVRFFLIQPASLATVCSKYYV